MAEDFRGIRDNHVENMERMFAAVSDLYAEYWSDFFHFAIFNDASEDRDTAFKRTHWNYAEALRVGSAAKVLDLACGRGGFTDFLAANTQGEVLGIDIARAQLSHAARYQRPNLLFRQHDVMRVDALGERFDAIAFIDAECYLPDKGTAVARIARVMNSGARLLLLAWCKRDGLGSIQEELVLHPFMRYWGVPGLETPTAYRGHFRRAGLRLIEEVDLNEKVRRNWEFGYQRAIEAIRDVSLARAAHLLWKGLPLGAEGIRLLKEQFHAALYIKAGFDAGFLRYTYFLAEHE